MDGIKSPFARQVLTHERDTSYRFATASGEKKTLSEINGAAMSVKMRSARHGGIGGQLSIALVPLASISPQNPNMLGLQSRFVVVTLAFLVCVI